MAGPNRLGAGRLVILLALASPPAFAAVPENYQPYNGLKDQFTIALPAGWSVYDQNGAVGGKPGPLGVVVFSSQSVAKEGETLADPGLMARVDSGELPSFFLDRQPAAKGMSCAKFTKAAAYELGVTLAQDPIFGAARSYFNTTPIKHDPVLIGGCQGYHYSGKGKKGEWMLDVRAVSDGKVLYLFSLRNKAENFSKNIATFDQAIGTLELSQP